MDFQSSSIKLIAEIDLAAVASALNCEIAAVKAVAEIESAGHGFMTDGRPRILFESRWFHQLTNGRFYNAPSSWEYSLSTQDWVQNYWGGPREYQRLHAAMQLDEDAALQSCSWGSFQILGVNYHRVGFSDVFDYVGDVVRAGEVSHLWHFARFVETGGLADELQRRDWHAFAYRYNGPGYRKNRYAEKMEAAYRFFDHGHDLMFGGQVMRIQDLQAMLNRRGLGEWLTEDGIFGPKTAAALKAFEEKNGLPVDGVIDDKVWDLLVNDT